LPTLLNHHGDTIMTSHHSKRTLRNGVEMPDIGLVAAAVKLTQLPIEF
jgi:hypothetical protein